MKFNIKIKLQNQNKIKELNHQYHIKTQNQKSFQTQTSINQTSKLKLKSSYSIMTVNAQGNMIEMTFPCALMMITTLIAMEYESMNFSVKS
ncbi:hypothetical protein A3207_08800 [Candidatus Methanomassiliicoccus intestinalis]|jgi:flagellar basal body L-ring protein FlgH|uniref:Uncharacterized protein n=1 Tax=Candidatus Methanomassiliicoccus intestinalis TaxID=1406512 RepID=A0A8J8TEX1_9ARCH|nr:MAG: hypothetical protein A3207_08800 [Candidatus Methanomassiliicoccus intestinalis]